VDVQDFGCDPTCHKINGGQSVQLNEQGSGRPHPEAYLYFTDDCTGTRQKTKGSGESKCTDIDGSDATVKWMSVTFEYNCLWLSE
jgi:hypothetical protein